MTDSQASLQALASNTYSSKLVKETITALNELGEQVHRLDIAWIKAHVGYVGNERADQLAREAEKQEDIELYIADSWSHYKNTLWESIGQEWEINWTAEDRFRLTKQFYPKPVHNHLKTIMNLS